VNITRWSNVVQIGAIDCASDENNDICRQYEVMRYPTMRYFSPNYAWGDKQLGANLDHLIMPKTPDLLDELTQLLVNETKGDQDWPKFEKFTGAQWKDLFEDAALGTKFVYVVNDELPGLLPAQAVLDNLNVEQASVRIVDGKSDLVKVNFNAFKVTTI
jgi:thiol oxidase